jgi:hypothetical protein
MTKTIEELLTENHELRDLVISLSATLLRNLALDPPQYDGNSSRADAESFLRKADKCFRCARIPGLQKGIADGLAAAGNELMARAVEIETKLQREKWKK